MGRIEPSDTFAQICKKMTGGHPGALSVMVEIEQNSPLAGGDGGWLAAVEVLDSEGVYHANLFALYRLVCDDDIVKLLAALRARQLDLLKEGALFAAARAALASLDGGSTDAIFDADAVLAQIQERLPDFGKSQLDAGD